MSEVIESVVDHPSYEYFVNLAQAVEVRLKEESVTLMGLEDERVWFIGEAQWVELIFTDSIFSGAIIHDTQPTKAGLIHTTSVNQTAEGIEWLHSLRRYEAEDMSYASSTFLGEREVATITGLLVGSECIHTTANDLMAEREVATLLRKAQRYERALGERGLAGFYTNNVNRIM